MRAVLAALRSPAYWRHGFSFIRTVEALLSAFGAMWLVAEMANFFSQAAGDWIRRQWIAFLVIGTVAAIVRNLPRVKFSCRLPNRDVVIEVRVADMFKLDGAFVIGSNTSFDTEIDSGLISPRSVQGQFTKEYYNSVAHLDADLNTALAGIAPIQTIAKKGKTAIFKVGTTVHVLTKGRRAYFVGIFTINPAGVAHGNFENLQTSLPELWTYIATKGGDFEPVNVPVLGSGYGRLSEPREQIIRTIVDSFVAACSSSRPTERMTIVIPFKDFYEHQVDLSELERYVQHVCRYSGYKEPSATGVGTAIA